ncbi:hypothetical protein C6P46_004135 [Rhodotorula mucilaginosa]|jgi:hypothetical protein|uniref:Uncharacterized protein n=1 Tax=Rhodotorula mucilaginosa TaxID=5537 RepID=A0A9P7B6K5_RHOMI|nr:hypothetical protein C6P46_004135 [Rhodotorula mucilaginosa]
MLASLWSWIAPTPRSSQAQQDGGPSPRLVAQLDNDDQQLPASTKRNRKKRQQHKKKKQQQAQRFQAHDEQREPDELLWHDEERRRSLDHYPDADQDESYLAVDDPSAETGATHKAAAEEEEEASSTRDPQRPTPSTATPTPGAATQNQGGVPPESLAVDDLVASMLAQGKTHPGPTGPLQRVHNLPEGAGQAPGLPLVRSTAESRRKAVEHGLVPITDEHGTLRVGFRIRDDIVLMHPKDLKGEPVLLRM